MEFIIETFNYWRPSLISWSLTVIQSFLILIIGWFFINKLCKIVMMFFQKAIEDAGITSFLYSLLKFSLRVILVIMVLGHMGLNVTSLFAALGASLVAIGISLKDSLSNIVSGIILVINKPIHVGDYIEFENAKGTVINIEMLFTTLQSENESTTVVIPNSLLISKNINRKSEYNIELIEVFYESDSFTDKYNEFNKYFEKEFILNNNILHIPAPEIETKSQKDNNILIRLKVWCQNKHTDKVKTAVEKTVNKLGEKYKINFYEKIGKDFNK